MWGDQKLYRKEWKDLWKFGAGVLPVSEAGILPAHRAGGTPALHWNLSFGVEAEGDVYDFVLVFGGFADGDFP